MDRIGGVKKIDPIGGTAVVGAGGRLSQLSKELHDGGVAFPNLPDVDKQSLAGAVSTATHGTGKTLPSMSSGLKEITLVTAGGDVLACSPDHDGDVFSAAQVSLGSLGILAEAEIEVVPSFRLVSETWVETLDNLLPRVMDLFDKHYTFEFFYMPFTNHCLCLSTDITQAPSTEIPENTDDEGLAALKALRNNFSKLTPIRKKLGHIAMSGAESEKYINDSWKVLTSERTVPFNEMEYHLPASIGLETLEKVIAHIEHYHSHVYFPIEVRFVKSDNAWLSPFYERDTISIAVHADHQDSYDFMFTDLEPIFLAAGGRPHWGKLNSLTAPELAAMYPRWEDFQRIRQSIDPTGAFANPYLEKVFGLKRRG
ncbi:MAG: D-arabinono-1,4-lactone oxidase [Halioglobus sp.]